MIQHSCLFWLCWIKKIKIKIIINYSNIIFFIRIFINIDLPTFQPKLNMIVLDFIVISFPLSFFDEIICFLRCLLYLCHYKMKMIYPTHFLYSFLSTMMKILSKKNISKINNTHTSLLFNKYSLRSFWRKNCWILL
jgi:hypothetical protein